MMVAVVYNNMTLMLTLMIIVLFAIVAIIVIYADRKNKANRGSFTGKYNDGSIRTKICLHCKRPMRETDKVCPSCGEPAEGYVKCEYCGHINKDTNALCEKCNGFL